MSGSRLSISTERPEQRDVIGSLAFHSSASTNSRQPKDPIMRDFGWRKCGFRTLVEVGYIRLRLGEGNRARGSREIRSTDDSAPPRLCGGGCNVAPHNGSRRMFDSFRKFLSEVSEGGEHP